MKNKWTRFISTVFVLSMAACVTTATPLQSPIQQTIPQPLPPIISSPSATVQPFQQTGQASLFKHILTVQVTPNENFSIGGGTDIIYVPATDRIAVIVQTVVDQPVDMPVCEVVEGKVVGYVEYTTDMQPTGKFDVLTCGFADMNALGVGNDVFIAKMKVPEPSEHQVQSGWWTLEKFSAITWEKLAAIDIQLDYPSEWDGDLSISYINNQIVVTSDTHSEGKADGSTHNHLFTTNLAPSGKFLLQPPDVPFHYPMISLLQQTNGDILMFTSDNLKGNLMVLRFDNKWKFLDQWTLRPNAYFPEGTVTDGRYIYIAYLDWNRAETQAGQNVHLAAYDAGWNLIEDMALTDVQSMGDLVYGEGTSIIIHGNRLYVFYNIITLDTDTNRPDTTQTKTYVDVLELAQQQ